MNNPSPLDARLNYRGRGGIHPVGGYDPFFDFDVVDRIRALERALFEHPAARPHLEQHNLCYGNHSDNADAIVIKCATCSPAACTCSLNLRERNSAYLVNCFDDPLLRPLFDDLRLAVTH